MSGAAIVTGGSRGLGRAACISLATAGYSVAVNYAERGKDADKVVKEITNAGGKAFAYRADVGNADEAAALIDAAIEQYGKIDVLVNNAGIAKPGLLIKLSEEDWDECVRVNLKGPFNMIKAVSRHMIRNRRGHIINVASIIGLKGKEGQAAYAATKAGLIGLTKAAAAELGSRGVCVNAVLPGYMLTEMGAGASRKARDAALRDNLLGGYTEPEEPARFIAHLVGMSSVSGQVFNLDSRII